MKHVKVSLPEDVVQKLEQSAGDRSLSDEIRRRIMLSLECDDSPWRQNIPRIISYGGRARRHVKESKSK